MSVCLGQVEGTRLKCPPAGVWLCVECRRLVSSSLLTINSGWGLLRSLVERSNSAGEECSRAGARTGSPALVDMDVVDLCQDIEVSLGGLAGMLQEDLGIFPRVVTVESITGILLRRFKQVFDTPEGEGLARVAICDLPPLARRLRDKTGADDIATPLAGTCRFRGCEAGLMSKHTRAGLVVFCLGAERHEFPIHSAFQPHEGRYTW